MMESVSFSYTTRSSYSNFSNVHSNAVSIVQEGVAAAAYSFRTAINIVILPILCVMGLAGNIINIIVLRRYGFKDTNIMLLASLSFNDLVLTLLHTIIKAGDIIKLVDVEAALRVIAFSAIYLNAPHQILVAINVCHVTTIAVERAIAVCFPFQASRLFTAHRIKWSIFVIYVFPFSMLTPAFFLYEHQWIYSPKLNISIAIAVETQFYTTNKESILIYLSVVAGNLFSTVVPLVIIASCVIVMLKLLQRRFSFPDKTSGKKGLGQKGMKMLFSVCVATILISVPGIILLNYCSFSHLTSGDLYDLLMDTSRMLCQLHASTNFIIYVTMSNKFYKAYKDLLGCSGEIKK